MGLRDNWLEKREKEAAAANGNRNMSQMHFSRQGVITDEMRFVAGREKIEPELVRSEVARGRMIIPANIHHRNLEPMAIGIASKCKINANIGNSSTNSNIDEELKKLHHAVHYGADTVMDLEDVSRRLGFQFDGLLGQDILNQFHSVRIDYKKHVIELEP